MRAAPQGRAVGERQEERRDRSRNPPARRARPAAVARRPRRPACPRRPHGARGPRDTGSRPCRCPSAGARRRSRPCCGRRARPPSRSPPSYSSPGSPRRPGSPPGPTAPSTACRALTAAWSPTVDRFPPARSRHRPRTPGRSWSGAWVTTRRPPRPAPGCWRPWWWTAPPPCGAPRSPSWTSGRPDAPAVRGHVRRAHLAAGPVARAAGRPPARRAPGHPTGAADERRAGRS